ncbi:STAS domain-containing protein [Neogemmobacter tilapiae]|jgi:anti-sigma B factor antagonist|uniref:Anti-sigma factor antagonist n=1 Tax=Neogemmobacter tilapiae TaxID=875041 RepID=A0A918WPQ3_9RHOB|nr:STAS domain-containing protein [Gemmobacter tilapiae]GHC66150.1 anti-sigma factor antagonist [Gemmobacter tilapiae]
MNLKSETMGNVLVVRVLEDRIDAASAIQFKEQMRDVIQTPLARVLLDLSQVMFLDSSGLGAVVAVMKLLGPDRKLELAGLTPTVDKVFRLTRMDGFVTIHPQMPDASQMRQAG